MINKILVSNTYYSFIIFDNKPIIIIIIIIIMVMLAKNPFNHVGMTQKVPYKPILVVLGPKLWSVTLKLCRRAKLSVPFTLNSVSPI